MSFAGLSLSFADVSKGIILNERVNMRTGPSISSEVIHQLHTGESVSMLQRIKLNEPQIGEPAEWVRIRIPKDVELWVFSEYLDETTQSVTASRLNVRSGPSQNHSVVGRINRGTIVETIRVSAGWTAIKAPDNTVAYVAAEFVRKASSPANIAENVAPPVLEKVENPKVENRIPEIIIDEKEIKASPVEAIQESSEISESFESSESSKLSKSLESLESSESSESSESLLSFSVSREVAEDLKRVITRDGILKRSLHLQTPTYYHLDDPRTGTTINYLSTQKLQLDLGNSKALKVYEGRKIRVMGAEAVDDRWPRIPVIEVETLRVLE